VCLSSCFSIGYQYYRHQLNEFRESRYEKHDSILTVLKLPDVNGTNMAAFSFDDYCISSREILYGDI